MNWALVGAVAFAAFAYGGTLAYFEVKYRDRLNNLHKELGAKEAQLFEARAEIERRNHLED
jgi:hypothetical protein